MTAGFPVHVRTFGEGPRRAVAIHCTQAHGGAWRGVARYLADRLTILAPDMPAHGKSGDWDCTGDLHDVTYGALLPLVQEAPVDLIGHSFGATVALRMAVEVPEQVRSLTLVEPVYFAAAQITDPAAVARHLEEAASYLDPIARGDLEDGARHFNRLWGDGTKWADIPDNVRRYMTDRIGLIPKQSPALFEDRPDLLAPARIARVAMPILLLDGSRSPSIMGATMSALAGFLPHARHVTVADAGHMVPITHPQETAEAIGALLEMA